MYYTIHIALIVSINLARVSDVFKKGPCYEKKNWPSLEHHCNESNVTTTER